jgi:hypothetical protein
VPNEPILDLGDIQGDVLEGLQKNSENFIFFKIQDPTNFKRDLKANVIPRITTAAVVHEREVINLLRQRCKEPISTLRSKCLHDVSRFVMRVRE